MPGRIFFEKEETMKSRIYLTALALAATFATTADAQQAYPGFPTLPMGLPMPVGQPFLFPGLPLPGMLPGYPLQLPTLPSLPAFPTLPFPGAMPYGAAPVAQPTPAPQPVAKAAPVAAPAVVTAPAPATTPAAAPVAQTVAPTSAPAPATSAAPTTATPTAPAAPVTAAAPVAKAVNPYLPTPAADIAAIAAATKEPYTVRRAITQQEKKQMLQLALPMVTGLMKMNMADAMNYFALKYKAKPGLAFDDVVESMKLRANQLNLKLVGENMMWKDFRAVLGDQDGPRIEVFSFCDIAVGRDLLKISPEFVIFLPCRVAVLEDKNKDIWVMMLDWNPEWVDGYKDRLQISDELWRGAIDIRQRMDNMMQAAANGDL
jgi:uncharacterized protein (DUF302 family)